MSEYAVLSETIPGLARQVAMKQVPEQTAVMNRRDGAPLRLAVTEWEKARTALVIDGPESVSPSQEAMRQQLARILESSLFLRSDKLSQFLRFIVEHVIAGNQDYLKEYVIGSEVYGRKPPYHPSRDSIVRTEARRLRSKLKDYYETEGKEDSVYVHFRLGSYIPIFRFRAGFAPRQNTPILQRTLASGKRPTVVAIFGLTDLSGSSHLSKCARGISDELALRLLCAHDCKVILPVPAERSSAHGPDFAAVMGKIGAHIAFEGNIREESNHIRVMARIVDGSGFHLWAKRFDADAAAQTMFALEEHIAETLSAAYHSLFAAHGFCGS
jgi:TolB-like protein